MCLSYTKKLKWHLGVCLSYTSVIASLEQTSTRLTTKLNKSKHVQQRKTEQKWGSLAGFQRHPIFLLFRFPYCLHNYFIEIWKFLTHMVNFHIFTRYNIVGLYICDTLQIHKWYIVDRTMIYTCYTIVLIFVLSYKCGCR